jgi:hypothetical protein
LYITKNGALDSQPQVIKSTSCLPMVGGSLRVKHQKSINQIYILIVNSEYSLFTIKIWLIDWFLVFNPESEVLLDLKNIESPVS